MNHRSILLVDDDREMVDSFSRWLNRRGYRTTPTYHPLQSLMAASKKRFDAAVIDIGLPDMNGIELLDELVALKLFPVIVLSGIPDPHVQSQAIHHGAFRCMIKPTPMEAIELTINEAVSSWAAATEPIVGKEPVGKWN